MYKIETDGEGKKYVEVGEYMLWLHETKVEVRVYGMVHEVHDYGENVRKIDALTNIIEYYHSCIGDSVLPF